MTPGPFARRVVRAHARRPTGSRGRAAVEPRRPRPRAALPARGRAEGRAAHGAPSAAARPRGCPGARPGARARGAARAPLRALQYLHRGGDLRAVPLRQARPVAALRRRNARRSPHDGADARLHGAVLRADGAPVAARRHRPARDSPRPADPPRDRRRRARGDSRDQLHQRGRGDGTHHRGAARRARARGVAPGARRAGRRGARVRRRGHPRAGPARSPERRRSSEAREA